MKETTTTSVVFFLGGCTYTEIAALRWVGRQNKGMRYYFKQDLAVINGVQQAEIFLLLQQEY
jgi:hypothetical protein